MLKTRYQHHQDILKSYHSNMKNIAADSNTAIAYTYTDKRTGKTWFKLRKNKRLNAKLSRCYPRGDDLWTRLVTMNGFFPNR